MIDSSKSLALVHAEKGKRISAQELHKYVMGLVGVFGLCIITYPIAIYRIAQKEDFASSRSHLRSLTADYKSIETYQTASRSTR